MRYSPEIIEKAENYRTHELAYFKELVVAENDDISPKINSIKRRRFRDTKDEEDWKKLTTKRQKNPPPVENAYLDMKNQEGLVQYESVDFYKNKAERQLM